MVLSLAVEHHSSIEYILQVFNDIAETIKNEAVNSAVSGRKNEIIEQFVESYIQKMDVRTEDTSYHFRLIRLGLERVQAYNATIELLEKIIQKSEDEKIRLNARLLIARNYVTTQV